MSTIEVRREPVPDRREPVLRRRYPATEGMPDDRMGPLPGSRGAAPAFGPLGSLGLHFAVVLVLLFHPTLSKPRAPEAQPIPVSLVVLPPKPKPVPKPPAPKPKPPPGRLASIDMGPRSPAKPAPRPGPPDAGAPQLETTALPLPPPPKLDAPEAETLPMKPPAAPKPRPRRATFEGRQAKYPGPSATKNEYLAYLAMLTRRHVGLLTPQLLAGRRGTTVLSVVILDNGTLGRIEVFHSSGYPEIDRKVEEIVRAVGRFPPLPQYVQGPAWEFKFFFPFPESMRE